jgi:hypothetical protein
MESFSEGANEQQHSSKNYGTANVMPFPSPANSSRAESGAGPTRGYNIPAGADPQGVAVIADPATAKAR